MSQPKRTFFANRETRSRRRPGFTGAADAADAAARFFLSTRPVSAAFPAPGLAAAAAIGAALALWADPCAAAAKTAPVTAPRAEPGKVKYFRYEQDGTYRLRADRNAVIVVQFPRGENFKSEDAIVALGDADSWSVQVKGRNIVFKPLNDARPTNMVVETNLRTYAFSLALRRSGQSADTIVRFKYPQTDETSATVAALAEEAGMGAGTGEEAGMGAGMGAPREPDLAPDPAPDAPNGGWREPAAPDKASALAEAKKPRPIDRLFELERQSRSGTPTTAWAAGKGGKSGGKGKGQPRIRINRDYWGQGDRRLAPTRMVDDGKKTYIEFGRNQSLPALYRLGADGGETPAEFEVAGDTLIAPGVERGFILRQGRLALALNNKAWGKKGKAARETAKKKPPKKAQAKARTKSA